MENILSTRNTCSPSGVLRFTRSVTTGSASGLFLEEVQRAEKKNSHRSLCPRRMASVLPDVSAVAPSQRIRSLRMLSEYQDWETARATEAVAYAVSRSRVMYCDKMQQIIYNLHAHGSLAQKPGLALMTNRELAKGTIIEDIEVESIQQCLRFEQILAEKYELVDRSGCKSTMRCRRCGNQDIVCEQKQTRGADEAMTVFCTCTKCCNRWTMR